jgi:acyl dehydratase
MAHQPRGRYFDDFKVGETFESQARTIEAGDVSLFAGLTGDFNPLHTDEETAKRLPLGSRVAHGLDKVRFTTPVRFGDTIHTELTVKETRESSKPDRGVVVLDTVVRNQRGEVVLQFEQAVLMLRRK